MKFGVFHQLPVAPGQSAVARYQETVAQVVHADALGFDVAWLAEGHFAPTFSAMSAPLVVAAALAARTTRLRLGTGVVQLPLHHPVRVAEEAATVDVLSSGRLELGVGRGTSPQHFAAFGVPWAERAARFDEALDVIERAWTERRVTYRGQHVRVEGIEVVPRPVQMPRPRIHVAANSAATAALAGRRGHGMLMSAAAHPLPDAFAAHVRAYRDARAETGAGDASGGSTDRAADPTAAAGEPGGCVSAVCWTFVGTSRAAVRARVAPSLARHPVGAGVPYDIAEAHMAIFGTPEECAARIAMLQEVAPVDELICWFNPGGLIPHADVMTAMEQFAAAVIPTVAPPATAMPAARGATAGPEGS
jgi:alkanesulfonate monooxygenase SsuD/methylene tetrahydromethanopterin reductase-like flavin-dependent oxidoreductase (luciferase family)